MSLLEDTLPARYRLEQRPAERFNRYRFELFCDDARIGRGTHFTGANHIRPWIELQPIVAFDAFDEQDQAFFAALGETVGPGGHIMAHYLQDAKTAELLTRNVPPPVTPIGYLLWVAGARWYKDWYFTEGWMEGDQKLQGNLPPDAETKAEREADWNTRLREHNLPDDQIVARLAEKVRTACNQSGI